MRKFIQLVSLGCLGYAGYKLFTITDPEVDKTIYTYVIYASAVVAVIMMLLAPSKKSKKYRNKRLKGYIR